MVDVVTGARSGVLSSRGRAWTRKTSCLLISREIIGRTAESRVRVSVPPGTRKALLNQPPPRLPERSCNCQTQFEVKFSTRMRNSRSCRQLTHALLAMSDQFAGCTHRLSKTSAPDMQTCRLAVLRSLRASTEAECKTGRNLNSAALLHTASACLTPGAQMLASCQLRVASSLASA